MGCWDSSTNWPTPATCRWKPRARPALPSPSQLVTVGEVTARSSQSEASFASWNVVNHLIPAESNSGPGCFEFNDCQIN